MLEDIKIVVNLDIHGHIYVKIINMKKKVKEYFEKRLEISPP